MNIADTSAQDVELERRSRKPLFVLVGLAIVGITALIVFAYPYLQRWSSSDRTVSAARLVFATVKEGDLVRDIPLQARVVAGVSPTLYATNSGIVKFTVETGDVVESDALLATIVNDFLHNEVLQRESSLKQLQSNVERVEIQAKQQQFENQRNIDLAQVAATAAQREANRAEASYSKQAISEFDYQKAQDDLQSAQFSLSYAQNFAELDKERTEFEHRAQLLAYEQQRLQVEDIQRKVSELEIRSPIKGIVGSLLVEERTFVNPGESIITVVDLTQFELEADVPESYAPELQPGIAAEARTTDRLISGTLISVAPEVVNGQVKVRIRFKEETGNELRQNQRISTRLLLEQRSNVLTLPRGPFLDTGGGEIAYIVEGGLAKRRRVNFGSRSTNSVEVLAGLESGQQVVISGTELFRGADSVYISR